MANCNVVYHVNNAKHLKRVALNHKQKVLSLYKQACKNIKFTYGDDFFTGQEKILELRQRFDANKDIKDFRKAKELLKKGQEELHNNRMPDITNYTYSPDGTAYHRAPEMMDMSIDLWSPYEKAMYPYYFARREQRKQEYIKLFESDYGDAEKLIGIETKIDYAALNEEFNAQMAAKDKKANE